MYGILHNYPYVVSVSYSFEVREVGGGGLGLSGGSGEFALERIRTDGKWQLAAV